MGVVDVGLAAMSSDSASVDGLEADTFIRRLSKRRDAMPSLPSVAAEPRPGSALQRSCMRTSQELS